MQLKEGKNYDPDSINQLSEKYMCIDPAFSSSQICNSCSRMVKI